MSTVAKIRTVQNWRYIGDLVLTLNNSRRAIIFSSANKADRRGENNGFLS